MMESKKYIHHGHDSFDRNLFTPIRNRELFVKPDGGLWASPMDAEYGWYELCRENDFHTRGLAKSFVFTLSEKAKVVHIGCVADLESLPNQKLPEWHSGRMVWKMIDFEKLLADGVDAVELHLSEDAELYWELYGWDCDSIIIMNPDIVEVI